MSSEIKQLLKDLKGHYIIGRLNLNDPFEIIDECLAIHITALSEDPLALKQSELNFNYEDDYIAIDEEQIGFEDFLYGGIDYTIENKKKTLKDKLTNKLIIFNPMYELDEDNNVLKYARILDFNNEDTGASNYLVIPKAKETLKNIEDDIFNGNPIKLDYYSDFYTSDELLIIDDDIYFADAEEQNKSILLPDEDEADLWSIDKRIKRTSCNYKEIKGYNKYLIKAGTYIYFIEDNFRNEIVNANKKDQIIVEESDIGINNFIETFTKNFKNKGLLYCEVDLYKICASLAVDKYAFLAGVKGEGKCILAELLGLTLGLSYENGSMLKTNARRDITYVINEIKTNIKTNTRLLIIDNIDRNNYLDYLKIAQNIKEDKYLYETNDLNVNEDLLILGIINENVDEDLMINRYVLGLKKYNIIDYKDLTILSNEIVTFEYDFAIKNYETNEKLYQIIDKFNQNFTVLNLGTLVSPADYKSIDVTCGLMHEISSSYAYDFILSKYIVSNIPEILKISGLDKDNINSLREGLIVYLNKNQSISSFAASKAKLKTILK